MSNSYFKKFSAVFACGHCGRRTRDTNGDNGRAGVCEDCHQGFMWNNGGMDASDDQERADCFAQADACFQRAVNRGGRIEGFEPSNV